MSDTPQDKPEPPTNRDVFVKTYENIVRLKFPDLGDGAVNDCVHGCLIAINSELGLSEETYETALLLGIAADDASIMKYVWERE